MVEFTLPKTSRVVTGKTWPKPEGAKDLRAFRVCRYTPHAPANPRIDTYCVERWRVHALTADDDTDVKVSCRLVHVHPLTHAEDRGIESKKIAQKARVY